MGEKLIFQACLTLALCFVQGCFVDWSGHAPILGDSGIWDASYDDGSIDGGQDSGTDAGMDAQIADAGDSGVEPEDSGMDSGFDAGIPDSGTDSGSDAGSDAGTDAGTDAGPPPRTVTLVFERTETVTFGPIISFWTRFGTAGSWGSATCVGGVLRAGEVYSCEIDRPFPRGMRESIRWYASDNASGTVGSCNALNCTFRGSHRVLLDGGSTPPADLSVEDSMLPTPPAGGIKVLLYVTPL